MKDAVRAWKQSRREAFVPLSQLNQAFAERCRDDLVRQLRGKTGTKAERLEEERSAFLSLR